MSVEPSRYAKVNLERKWYDELVVLARANDRPVSRELARAVRAHVAGADGVQADRRAADVAKGRPAGHTDLVDLGFESSPPSVPASAPKKPPAIPGVGKASDLPFSKQAQAKGRRA